MTTIRRLALAACMSMAVFIGRASATTGVMPDPTRRSASRLIAPGEAVPTTDEFDGRIVRGRIDPARYAAGPIDVRERARPLWLAATATLGLALAALAPRRPTSAVIGVAIAGSIGLAIPLARRPAVARVDDDGNGIVWLVARRPGAASVPIADGAACVPIVESIRHWQALAPRVVGDTTGRESLVLTFVAPGARVALARR